MLRLFRDLRYAARQLRRMPGFTAITVLTLALGIAASTAVFAVVNAIVFRPAGLAKVDHVMLVHLATRRVKGVIPEQPPTFRPLTNTDFQSFAAQPPDPIVAAAGVQWATVTIRIPGKAERVNAEAVAGDYQRVFRVGTAAGRFIGREDDAGGTLTAVVSERLWRGWFGGDREAIGRASLTIDQQPLTIVGVAPRAFRGLMGSGGNVDVWLPSTVWRRLRLARSQRPLDATAPEYQRRIREAELRNQHLFAGQIYVRHRPDAGRPAAEAAAATLFAETIASGDRQALSVGVRQAADVLRVDELRPVGLAFLSLAALVLLAACANLANLLYTRSVRRAGEIAVRLSLGGRPSDIFRLFFAETTIIATLALGVALGLVSIGLSVMGVASGSLMHPQGNLASRSRTGTFDVPFDAPVILYAVGAGVLAALVVGLATAWRASRVPPLRTLAAAGMGASTAGTGAWRRRALVAVQVTAAVLLLMGTGLYVRRALDVLDTRALFDTSHVTAARIDLSLHDYNPARGQTFYQEAIDRIGAIPGVEHAALADGLPGYDYVSLENFLLVPELGATGSGDQRRRITGAYAGVSAGFLDTLGLPLRSGRPFTSTDGAGTPLVTIVCESAARRLWPGEDPIGKRLMFGNEGYWRTVVGVSADPMVSRKDSANVCASCVVFVPWDQRYRPHLLILARSAAPAGLVDPITAAIHAIDPEVAVHDVAPLDDSILAWVRPARAANGLMLSLGLVALAIATLGVYAVVSFLVSARTREFGIRLALGATPARVVGMVLDQAVHLLLVGLLPGVLIASLGSRLLESRIRNLMPNDIPTWIAVPILVLVVGLIAGYVPARRAARIDPTRALRDL